MNDNEPSSKLEIREKFCRIEASVHIEGPHLGMGITWHKITIHNILCGHHGLQ